MPYPNVSLSRGIRSRTVGWGDLYWFDFGTPASHQYTIAGPRPCVVLSNASTIHGRTLVVSPLTGSENAVPRYAYNVPIAKSECPALDKDSVVKIDHLYNINRDDLIDQHYIASLSPALMRKIYLQLANALNFRAAFPSSPR